MASPHLLPLISFTLGPVTLSWSPRKGRAWRGRRTVASLPTAAWGQVCRGGHCQLVLSKEQSGSRTRGPSALAGWEGAPQTGGKRGCPALRGGCLPLCLTCSLLSGPLGMAAQGVWAQRRDGSKLPTACGQRCDVQAEPRPPGTSAHRKNPAGTTLFPPLLPSLLSESAGWDPLDRLHPGGLPPQPGLGHSVPNVALQAP